MATILVADEDYDTRAILKLALKEINVNVVEATDPETARRILEHHELDAVVLNYPMHLPNGKTLTRSIRANERLAELPIINLTSHATPRDLGNALADGATYTLAKPVDIATLLPLVQAAVNSPADL